MTYSKKALDDLIDLRDVMKKRLDEAAARLHLAQAAYRNIVTELQAACPHDEGRVKRPFPRYDTLGNMIASYVEHTCKLCDKVLKGEP